MNLSLLGRVENLKIIYFSASTEMMSLYSPSTSTRAPPQSIVDAKSWDRILFTHKKNFLGTYLEGVISKSWRGRKRTLRTHKAKDFLGIV